MRVLLPTYAGRGDVEPLAGLAVRLRAYGATVTAKLLLDAHWPPAISDRS